jgi:tetratricopeptide (TPR) repeat protein
MMAGGAAGCQTSGPSATAAQLRAAVTGLLGFAASREQELLAAPDAVAAGSPQCWAAVPLIAHTAEFRQQQVQRLTAIGAGVRPPDFSEIDHRSEQVYRSYSDQLEAVAEASLAATSALVSAFAATRDEDLLDPSRNQWLRGRMLWLQVIVRGFWHPCGHIGGYYLDRGQHDRAVGVAAQAVAAAADLNAPGPARGMAYYNLACAHARAGQQEAAVAAIADAIRLNPELRANAGRDDDLAELRGSGRLADVLRA